MRAVNIQNRCADTEREVCGLHGETRTQCAAVAKLRAQFDKTDVADEVEDALRFFDSYIGRFGGKYEPLRTVAHTLTHPVNYLGESFISNQSPSSYFGDAFELDYVNTENNPLARLRWIEQLANRLEANIQYLELGKKAPLVRGADKKLHGWQAHLSEIAYIYRWTEHYHLPVFIDTRGQLRLMYSKSQLERTFDAISVRNEGADTLSAYAHLAMLTAKDSLLRPTVEKKKEKLRQIISRSEYSDADLGGELVNAIGRLRCDPLLKDAVPKNVAETMDAAAHRKLKIANRYANYATGEAMGLY